MKEVNKLFEMNKTVQENERKCRRRRVMKKFTVNLIMLSLIFFTFGCDEIKTNTDLNESNYLNNQLNSKNEDDSKAQEETDTKEEKKSTTTTSTTTTTTTTKTTKKTTTSQKPTTKSNITSTTTNTTKKIVTITTTTASENKQLPLKAICNDGTISYQDNPSKPDYRGMCSGHGGIRQKLGRVE